MQRTLVYRAKLGDEEAFDTLARTVGDRCMAIACRILRDVDLAEDAVQAALLTAWEDIRVLRDPDRFEPWLHRILTNACHAEARRGRRWSAQIHDQVLPLLTRAGAHATFEEDRKGTITAGKLADLVVLDADPRAVEPERIGDVNVLLTMIGGRAAYCAAGSEALCPAVA